MVYCNSVRKSYGNKEVITNFTYKFSEGLTYLNGKNGSGKSTLLRLISGIENLDSGSIAIDKCAIISLSTDSVQIPEVFTPYEVYKMLGNYNEVDNELFQHLVNEMDVNKFLHIRFAKLSSGTKKKIANILALSKKSDILILDEPFNGLDESSIEILVKTLSENHTSKIITDHYQFLKPDFSVYI